MKKNNKLLNFLRNKIKFYYTLLCQLSYKFLFYSYINPYCFALLINIILRLCCIKYTWWTHDYVEFTPNDNYKHSIDFINSSPKSPDVNLVDQDIFNNRNLNLKINNIRDLKIYSKENYERVLGIEYIYSRSSIGSYELFKEKWENAPPQNIGEIQSIKKVIVRLETRYKGNTANALYDINRTLTFNKPGFIIYKDKLYTTRKFLSLPPED